MLVGWLLEMPTVWLFVCSFCEGRDAEPSVLRLNIRRVCQTLLGSAFNFVASTLLSIEGESGTEVMGCEATSTAVTLNKAFV